MRYASRLDYFLFNTLFRREGLRLSGFANGLRFWYYRPLRDALRTLARQPRGVPQDVELVRAREYCRELTREGGSLFLFLRTASLRSQLPEPAGAHRAGAPGARPAHRGGRLGAELGPSRCSWCRSRCSGARVRARGAAS